MPVGVVVSCVLLASASLPAPSFEPVREPLPPGGAGVSAPRYRVALLAPVPGFDYSTPTAMNDRGRVVGYAAPEPFHPVSDALIGHVGGPTLPLPGQDPSFNHALGINDKGLVAGRTLLQACIWESGALRVLATGCCWSSGTAWDVSESGLAVGSLGDSDFVGPQHCYWPSPTSDPVFLPGITQENQAGQATGINRAGRIAGVSGGFAGSFFAVRWESPTSEPLVLGLLPGAFNSEARAINELGDVCGRSSGPTETQAFLYRDATSALEGLGFLPGGNAYSEAFGLNDFGDVVGTASASDGTAHAFLWESDTRTMLDLNDLILPSTELLYLSSAVAINERGAIAAEAVVGAFPEARIAVLLPLPRHQPVQGWDVLVDER